MHDLICKVRAHKDIGVILYSGFKINELRNKDDYRPILSSIDILIDGQYEKTLDDGRAYVGSSNQKIHYLTERYKKAGPIYYAAAKRKAEIKFTSGQAVLIGVPTARVLRAWKDILKKTGGAVSDF